MKNKKILILGSKEDYSLENMYKRAFKFYGIRTDLFHVYDIEKGFFKKFLWKYLRFIEYYLIRRKIISYFRSNQINYDLVVIFKGLYLNKNVLEIIKDSLKGAKFINIFPDNPLDINYFKDISNYNILKIIPYFDNIFIYSKIILKKLRLRYPKSKFHYLPFAHDNKIHKKFLSDHNNKNKFDLSFIGTADKKRYRIINKLKKYNIILAGNGWKKFKLSKNIHYIGNVNSDEFSKCISSSKLSLNILRKQNVNSHNMKTFEIPSMGGLMITERSTEQDSFFPENKACLMYKNINELKLKINDVTLNQYKYKKILNKGFLLAKKNTYLSRVKYLMNIIYER